MALPWQKLFWYIISVLVAISRPTDTGKKKSPHRPPIQYVSVYRYTPTHYMHIQGVWEQCVSLLIHQYHVWAEVSDF